MCITLIVMSLQFFFFSEKSFTGNIPVFIPCPSLRKSYIVFTHNIIIKS